MDCPDACSLVATLDGDRVIRLRGNPEHPFTNGFTCRKIKNHLKRLQSPERIVHPMVRRGARWKEIGWEAALDLCAEKIDALRDRPAAIAHVRASGAKGVTKEIVSLFFDHLGASLTRGSLCDAAGIMAYHHDFGSRRNHRIDDIFNARRIVNWGKDLSRSSIHLAAVVRKARKKGISVLLISPCQEGNHPFRDHQILIRPGTDRFLAAAVLRRLVQNRAVDADAVEHVRHWQVFHKMLLDRPEEALIQACGVSPQDVDLLYAYYTGDGPAATLVGAGVQRYARGGENVRFINALALLSGNVGRRGGGSHFHLHSTGMLNMKWARAPQRSRRRSLQMATIGRDLLAARDPQIELLWINGVNLVNQAPDSHRIMEAFERVPFKIVVDAFFNDTAMRADLVLPAALMLEQEDLIGSYLHNYVQYVPRTVNPPGEARTDHWIVRELGRRLHPPVVLPSARQCMAAALEAPGISVTLDPLRRMGFVEVPISKVPYADLQFDHPDGLARLPMRLHDEFTAHGDYPLRLLSLIRREAIHSQLLAEDQQGLPRVWVSPDCPSLAPLNLDAPVFIASPLGRIQVRVSVMDELHADAVVYRRGDWMAMGGGINRIISDQPTDIGGGAAYYHQFVRLENG
jgi:anaerobic selenocysteine-containing dehydrogenase